MDSTRRIQTTAPALLAAMAAMVLATLPTPAVAQLGESVRTDSAQRDTPVPGSTLVPGHSFRPEQRDFDPVHLENIDLPAGFSIQAFATDMGNPRMLAAAEDGSVYVTRPGQGDVVRLRDVDGDGRAEDRTTVVRGLPEVHGIALDGSTLYLVDIHNVYVATIAPDGTVSEPRTILDVLPDAGQHPNRTVRVGPDGMLYISVGSLANAVPAPDSMGATLLRARADGSDLRIFAENLRNTIGYDWDPATGELWAMDHNIDWLGDDEHREELNRVVEGANYGWPHCYDNRTPNPTKDPPEGYDSVAEYCAETTPAVLGYQAHTAPMQMSFYRGDAFPAEYRDDAFVAMRGSWNRYPPVGYEVVRVRFQDGDPVAIEPFASNWLLDDGASHFGRLAGLAVTPDGAIIVSDDTNGVLYRITYDR